MPLCDVERLRSEIENGTAFTVRAVVMRRDEWSGYFGLLDIKDGSGEEFLNEVSVLEARKSARTEKLAVLGAVALLCGGAFAFYTVIAVKEVKRKNKI